MTEVKFKNRKPNTEKLLSFGFVKTDKGYAYETDLTDRQMTMTVKIDDGERVYTEVIDNNSGYEYVLHLVVGTTGTFVGQVKREYEAVLEEISSKCFDTEIFKGKQAKEIIAYVRNAYGDELEYLWQKFPDNAVVRRKDNQKWYAIFLTVSRRKLGFDSDEVVEILDLRMSPEDIQSSLDGEKILPGYHMNKKHWITICLDGTMANEEIFEKIDDSYRLAKK